jgi:hypothetical protein
MAVLNYVAEQRISKQNFSRDGYGKRASIGLFAVSAVLALGRIFDIGVLWILQRQNTPQWEFMALSNTIDVVPGLVLAAGVAYCALQIARSQSVVSYRLLAGCLILLGLMAAGIGAMLATDYLALAQYAQPRAIGILRSTAIRGIVLSGMFFILLVPAGVYGVSRPQNDAIKSRLPTK